jgi:hypothetical protein
MKQNWLRNLKALIAPQAKVSRKRVRLAVEAFEDRVVPTAQTFTVNTALDLNAADAAAAGVESLRSALTKAEANANPADTDVINFAPSLAGQTITLNPTGLLGALPDITQSVRIQGLGDNTVTPSGIRLTCNNNSLAHFFDIESASASTKVNVSGLELTGAFDGIFVGGPGTDNFSQLNIRNNIGFGVSVGSFAANVTIDQSELSNNCGGIFTFAGPAVLKVATSTLAQNSGAGVAVAAGVSATLDQDTVTGNGGGVTFASPTVSQIVNSTINNNTGVGIGGSGSFLTLSSDIVSGNNAAHPAVGDVAGTPPAANSDHNFIGNAQGIGGTAAFSTATNQVGTQAVPLNAQLGALANNGGPTRTELPLAGSPVLDRGTANGTLTDQRGSPRTVGAAADIGAVESASATTTAAGTTPAPTPAPTPGTTTGTPGGTTNGTAMGTK